MAKPEQEPEPATAAPEKADQNKHDPGITIMQMAVPEKTEPVESTSSQTQTQVTPSSEGAPETAITKTKGQAGKASGTVRFGDGEHGQIPQSSEPVDDKDAIKRKKKEQKSKRN
jgi:hypothetical protein